MVRFIDYLIFHLDCLYRRMDTFKHKSRGLEKLWLCVIISMFIGMCLSSIDNIFMNKFLLSQSRYFFFILYPFLLLIIYILFVKNERFLEHGFKESYKGYLSLIILFLIMIYLMGQVKPNKQITYLGSLYLSSF